MERSTALTWSWLNVLTKNRYAALLKAYGSLDAALPSLNEEMLRSLSCREETAMKALLRLEEFDADAYQQELAKRGIELISMEDSSYPASLKNCDDPPFFLSYKGSLAVLTHPCIAMVGSREMSPYGKRVTEHLVPEIVRAGVVTVSGLAYGVDALVARETLRSGGRTVAVLGHGFGMMFPRGHAALAEEIVATGGLLLSEFPLDIPPGKYTFPARNRIIAGLSLGTVVLEASAESGTLITADLALDYNREVFAVPGQIFDANYAGCHLLIQKGLAKLVTSARDVLVEFGITEMRESSAQRLQVKAESPEEEKIIGALTTMPQSLDDLLVKTALDTAVANAVLTMLEVRGIAKNVGEGKWVRA